MCYNKTMTFIKLKKMTTGIIYITKNTISNKCYIGKTTRTLEQRIKEHLRHTIKFDYKFGRALQKYPTDSWKWSILAEVPVEELDEYEKFFITDLDTYKKGYNSHIGGDWGGVGNPKSDIKVYKLWHPEFGEIKETIGELCKRHDSFSKHFYLLVSGERQHINGYVLLENKDKYQEIVKTYSFYHPQVGVVNCTTKELFSNYRDYFKSKENRVHMLTNKTVALHHGWCLAENKDKYETLINSSTSITLTHKEHGALTLKRSEFKEKYGLTDSGISFLKSGKYKSSLGWTFVEETH